MVQKRPSAPRPPPAAPTRPAFVDLSKLRKTSLKRYKKHFKLDVKADSKGELLAAVSTHFHAMAVREADVALEFHEFARRAHRKAAAAAEVAAEVAQRQQAQQAQVQAQAQIHMQQAQIMQHHKVPAAAPAVRR